MEKVKTEQTCYTYKSRELAGKLGLRVMPDEWVIVEIDDDTVDVLVRKRIE
jgi:hypothetical protein